MSNHSCHTIIVTCIDFRFQKYIRGWTDKHLKGKAFDLVGFAGSTKDSDTIMKQIDISVRLHNTKEAILIHHEDCGAYGSESNQKNHTKDLRYAHDKILSRFPHLNITAYYLHLDGTFEKIQFTKSSNLS